ncbi:DUF924 family protein [Nannocystis bainbridge]|uniref:DUF924 domain-containing protein n=1 Tax=Nannocystis bainbridge TaxID=2995303 RepID=A0ABT5DW00_9BACT|nr:DUF924 family protein [Nannocystis bainbridge]MDC0717328.1 DUF924 domain-containing protein [Nannocystis bainbridge]
MSTPDAVLDFWFSPPVRPKWFVRSDDLDRDIRDQFGELHARAASGALDGWAASSRGALALVILLDQFPRNMFRGTPEAFATDAKARDVANAALSAGLEHDLTQEERLFLYLPLEHSEDLADQERCVELMRALDETPMWLDYAIRHRDIIARFGRFPHRNSVLGRESTGEECEFLIQPGSSF